MIYPPLSTASRLLRCHRCLDSLFPGAVTTPENFVSLLDDVAKRVFDHLTDAEFAAADAKLLGWPATRYDHEA